MIDLTLTLRRSINKIRRDLNENDEREPNANTVLYFIIKKILLILYYKKNKQMEKKGKRKKKEKKEEKGKEGIRN